jgi:hypothetical protein
MLDMEAIVRRQDQERCASITSMIRHYVARRAQVTEGQSSAEPDFCPSDALRAAGDAEHREFLGLVIGLTLLAITGAGALGRAEVATRH